MGDENSLETMNLDLNLDPDGSSPESDPTPDSLLLSNFANNNEVEEINNNNNDSVNLEDWMEGQQNGDPVNNIVRESSSSSYRPHRIRRWRSLLGSPNLNPPFLHPGEGSVSNNNNNNVVLLAKECCSKNEGVRIEQAESKILRKEEGGGGEEGGNEEEDGSFFECNICLDVSSDPVLTCCGHLFCWPCLYQWLNVHSDSKECPVCKGEVTVKNLTPIYGRGGGGAGGSCITNDQKPCLKIPDRPQAKRVESWRQTIQRNAFAFPMDEMIRRLGSGSDFPRDSIENHPLSIESLNESHERNSSLLNRILTSRGMRQEQAVVPPQEDADDGGFTNARSHTYRSLHAYRAVPNGEIVNIARRLMEYTSGEQDLLPVDDRDSVSSIAAVIQSESQTLDTAMEIDSTVSLFTSSSRRRVDAPSMVSDVDSGDSRAPRRRRLN